MPAPRTHTCVLKVDRHQARYAREIYDKPPMPVSQYLRVSFSELTFLLISGPVGTPAMSVHLYTNIIAWMGAESTGARAGKKYAHSLNMWCFDVVCSVTHQRVPGRSSAGYDVEFSKRTGMYGRTENRRVTQEDIGGSLFDATTFFRALVASFYLERLAWCNQEARDTSPPTRYHSYTKDLLPNTINVMISEYIATWYMLLGPC